MIVTCPRCLTKFNFSGENQAFEAEINFRCGRCQEEFVSIFQESSAAPADVTVSLSEPGSDELPVPDDTESLVDIDEIELDEDFTSFSEKAAISPEIELELDDDELSAAGVAASMDDSAGDAAEILETKVPAGSSASEIEESSLSSDVADPDDSVSSTEDGGFDAVVGDKTEKSDPDNEQTATNEVHESPEAQPSAGGGSWNNSLSLFIGTILILGLVFLIGFSMWQQFSLDMEKHLQVVEVSNQRLRLASDREVVILKGKVVNSSPKTVTELKIKGVLLDSNGKTVAEVVTVGGVSFALDELDRMDGNKLALLEKMGADLPSDGGELPFMLVFYECPDDAGKGYVEISSFKVK